MTPAFTPPTTPWNWADDSAWAGRTALVLGVGESSRATAVWLMARGLRVRMADTRSGLAIPESLIAAVEAGQLSLLQGCASGFEGLDLTGIDLLVPTPGLSPRPGRSGSIAHLLQQARQTGIAIAAELDLFDWGHRSSLLAEGLKPAAVIAITGTNGKTTTATLAAHLLESAGLRAGLAGNVSPSLLAALREAEISGQWPDVWVLELSSFQLAHAHRFQPDAACCLNFAEDHLDWHLDLDDYLQAKLRVHGLPQPSGRLILNADEPLLVTALRGPAFASAEVEAFGLQSLEKRPDLAWGLMTDRLTWLAHRPETIPEKGRRRSRSAPAAEPSALSRLMPADAMGIRGPHNWSNALAALSLCQAAGAPIAGLLDGLRTYAPEPHRLEQVAEVAGVAYINDSKATNVHAALAGLRSVEGPLVVLLGGDGKGQDFSPLGPALAEREAVVVTIGRDGPQLAAIARAEGLQTHECASLEEAVALATDLAREQVAARGRATVLLSPACASLDMFRSYAHRSEVFYRSIPEVLA